MWDTHGIYVNGRNLRTYQSRAHKRVTASLPTQDDIWAFKKKIENSTWNEYFFLFFVEYC